MIHVRKSKERGHAEKGWLESYHTFSFGEYYDPLHSGFRNLQVINEDRVLQGTGFGEHDHEDMEIISYILEGELQHKDSMGSGSILKAGDVQRMSAGSGVLHSEMNPSKTDPVHFLQIWITPRQGGIKPSYEEKHFSAEEKKNALKLIVAPQGENGALGINQDAKLYASLLDASQTVSLELKENRHAWIQIARGAVNINGVTLTQGDGASIRDEQSLVIRADQASEFLLFDLS